MTEMFTTCKRCRGVKHVFGLGGMDMECPDCEGKGSFPVAEQKTEEPQKEPTKIVQTVNKEKLGVQTERRGRKGGG